MKVNLHQVIERLEKAKRLLVIGHIKPDGDDISSVVSLVMIMRKLGKTAEGCIAGEIPWNYRKLDGVELIKGVSELAGYQYDTAVTVDCSDLSRIGDAAALLKGQKPDINIDHHQTNSGFARLDLYDSTYAATAVIIYEIGKELVEYDKPLAQINLLGIATDTGFFKYSNVDRKVFDYAARLVNAGASVQQISSAILESRTLKQVKLLCQTFDRLHIEEQERLAWAEISFQMLKAAGCTDDDADDIVEEIRSLQGVEIAVLFIEWPKEDIHISFRSKNYADVSKVASKFGGGGHARAAGCTCKNANLEKISKMVIDEASRAL
jgi:phosphoesterase RecJ-like protein